MFGESIIARSISAARIEDKFGNFWQYHSQSDSHSKIASWAVMFDLLRASSLVRAHVASGKVNFGINHRLRDFRQNRQKNLDLVLCSGGEDSGGPALFADYGQKVGVVLSQEEEKALAEIPNLRSGRVANVLLAVEAKACMTEHVKAQPRLYDELASSYQTIHGDTNRAIAAGFVMINSADTFVSPKRNARRIRRGAFVVNQHNQPHAMRVTLAKVMELPRRSDERDHGFDGLGVTMIRCRNDGSPVVVDTLANTSISGIVTYAAFIERLAHLYATKFAAV